MKTFMTALLRAALLSLVLVAAFALPAGQVQAKCDPADPGCKPKVTKKETPKKPASHARKPKKTTASARPPSDHGGKHNTQTGNTPKAKKSVARAEPKEHITEENRPQAEKPSSRQPVHVNPVEIDKATGKHCSGQDEFRVCW